MAQGIVHDGNKAVTTAGTREALSSSHIFANWLLIQPKPANTGIVYLGGLTVSSTSGVEMSVGDSDVVWPVVGTNVYDLSTIYIDVSVSGEGVKFIYMSL